MSTARGDLEDYREELTFRARDTGADSALVSAGLWLDLARGAIAYLAASGRHFTADDVRRLAGEPPSDNALGAVLLAASKRHEIVTVGFDRSKRVTRRGGMVRVWKGTEGNREEETWTGLP